MEKEQLLAIGNDRLRRLATYASIVVATILIITKLGAYLMTDSVAVLSSLLDSTIDLIASMITAYGVASALEPPDREHRYGHGKAEPLSALAQSAFIIGSSILLGYEAISRLIHPQALQNEAVGYGAMALAIILTVALVVFQHLVVKRTRSVAIGADHLHYLGDLGVNLAVIVALALYQVTGITWFDPLFGIAIAGTLSAVAIRIALRALDMLMDKELGDEDRARIKNITMSNDAVRGVHDMRTRYDSDRVFIELHIELSPDLALALAHGVAEDVMAKIQVAYPHADVLVHLDPEGIEETRLDAQIARR